MPVPWIFEEIVEVRFWTSATADRRALSWCTASGLSRPAIFLFVVVLTVQKEICKSFVNPVISVVTESAVCFETGFSLQANSVQKYVLLCTVEQMVDVPFFSGYERKMEIIRISPRSFSVHIIEQIVYVPVP